MKIIGRYYALMSQRDYALTMVYPFQKCYKSSHTLVIGLYKIGLIQDSALPFIGKLNLIDIGVSTNQLSKVERRFLNLIKI